ncbi:terminal glutamine amidohydrolase [Seminavis robusta]|uniref:Protein N-terminal glutamine amidohydrolase n=1 Tax=Seminavis robusta TaxID=568900 RepID=A0A9N8EUE9_9STRA|nr:terminal glutamine amidohydrolase [Seminavis robusta]|eukprot:Sro1715_g293110.1 terminal glutamine amidohydrolase (245) ;mRNA; f:20103-20837
MMDEEGTATTTNNNTEPSAEATALSASSDQELRVPCYCEENVWRLAYRKLQQSQAAKTEQAYFAVFVSNPSKCVCFFRQKANSNPLKPIFWDYHVLLLEQQKNSTTGGESLIWDIDSYLSYPCPLAHYLDRAFPGPQQFDKEDLAKIAPYFRVVPVETFLRYFSSDRSHMWDAVKQQWMATPPTYRCIQGASHKAKAANDDDDKSQNKASSNLMTYMDMTQKLDDPIFGSVLTRQELEERFLSA